jgi:hypothetical protein
MRTASTLATAVTAPHRLRFMLTGRRFGLAGSVDLGELLGPSCRQTVRPMVRVGVSRSGCADDGELALVGVRQYGLVGDHPAWDFAPI